MKTAQYRAGLTGRGAGMTDDDIIDRLLQFEGGYVDHPDDRGGPTNFGVTLATLQDWRGRPVTADDVRSMRRDEARAIYRKRYIADYGLDRVVTPELRLILVDCGVLYGPRRAIRWLQIALKVAADGELGPATLKALTTADPRSIGRAVLEQRFDRIRQRVAEDTTQTVFLKGWTNRTNALLAFC